MCILALARQTSLGLETWFYQFLAIPILLLTRSGTSKNCFQELMLPLILQLLLLQLASISPTILLQLAWRLFLLSQDIQQLSIVVTASGEEEQRSSTSAEDQCSWSSPQGTGPPQSSPDISSWQLLKDGSHSTSYLGVSPLLYPGLDSSFLRSCHSEASSYFVLHSALSPLLSPSWQFFLGFGSLKFYFSEI